MRFKGESLETYFVAYYAYFTAELRQLKTLGQFENLVFVIVSTRENIRLIARTPFQIMMYFRLVLIICMQGNFCMLFVIC